MFLMNLESSSLKETCTRGTFVHTGIFARGDRSSSVGGLFGEARSLISASIRTRSPQPFGKASTYSTTCLKRAPGWHIRQAS